MKDFFILDHAIMAAVTRGKKEHCVLCQDEDVKSSAMPFVTATAPVFRVVDRRMQSLRKRGLLSWTRADGWSVSP